MSEGSGRTIRCDIVEQLVRGEVELVFAASGESWACGFDEICKRRNDINVIVTRQENDDGSRDLSHQRSPQGASGHLEACATNPAIGAHFAEAGPESDSSLHWTDAAWCQRKALNGSTTIRDESSKSFDAAMAELYFQPGLRLVEIRVR